MTLKIGTIQADINADTSGLKKAESEVKRSTDSMEREFKSVDKAAKTTGAQMRNLRSAAGQLGFQVQDIAVQLQSGTNALIVLGQQGSQIAGIFGPTGAIVGGLIAVGAAVGTALLPKLFESKDAVTQLDDSLEALDGTVTKTSSGVTILTEDIIKLAKESENAAQTAIRGGLVESMNAINAATKLASKALSDDFNLVAGQSGREQRALQAQIKRTAEEFGITTTEVLKIRDAFISFKEDKNAETLQELQNVMDSVAATNSKAKNEFITLTQSIREFSTDATRAKEANEELIKIQGNLGEAVKKAEEELAKSAFSEKIIEQRLEQIRQLNETELQEIDRVYEERRQFILSQEQLTEDERASLIQTAADKRLADIAAINNREIQEAQRAAEQKRRLEKRQFNEQIQLMNASSQAVGELQQAGILEARQTALIQAGISLGTNIAKASEVGFPQNIPFIAGAIAQGAKVKNLITGGGRQFGGPTSGSLAHPVNEAGVPEVLTQADGKQFLLPTGSPGTVTPLSSGGVGSPKITMINNGTPQKVDNVSMSGGEIRMMISDATNAVEKRINTSLATGRGDTSQALKSGFKLERKL